MHSVSSSSPDTAPAAPVSLREGLYRYFFYSWLFRDAFEGSTLERAQALRHNREQARWMPVYIRRWIVLGAVIAALESCSEHVLRSPVLSAALAVALFFVVLYLIIAGICWRFLLDVGRRPK